MSYILQIRDLTAGIEGKEILRGLSLTIQAGEVHAIMGPNGAGKSTLARVLAGHPDYEVFSGEVWFQGKDLFAMEPEERAAAGLFIGFQYPLEICGISNETFLFEALNAQRKGRGEALLPREEFQQKLAAKMEEMEIRPEFKGRGINEGFSGGEKKRNEILQMSLLEPILPLLDETDSGLDIDAMRVVARGVNRMRSPDRSFLLITHYQRLLDLISPDFVHILDQGRIVRSGGAELALELEARGYR